MTMHGSGKTFHGAGATPSMGLSQFRGGAKKGKKVYHESESDEDEMEGGAGFTSLISRAPLRVPARIPARIPTSRAIVPLGPAGRPMARPALSAEEYASMFRTSSRPTAASSRAITNTRTSLASRFKKGLTAQNIANAIAMGVPLGMLGSYLADQSGASGDAGYYDEYAGEDFTGDDGDGGDTGGIDTGGIDTGVPTGTTTGGVPPDMSADELAWYLQTGNLPTRYDIRRRGGPKRKGKGKLTIEHEGGASLAEMMRGKVGQQRRVCTMGMDARSIACRRGEDYAPPTSKVPTAPKPSSRFEAMLRPQQPSVGMKGGRSARAAIVKKVMAERGVSLAQASKIVKEEGLY